MCRVYCCVVGRRCLLWPVGSLGKILLAFALLHSTFQGQIACFSRCFQQIWKTQQWPQDWKRSVFIPIPKKGNVKNDQTTTQLHSSHMLVEECSKFYKPGFSNTWTLNSLMFKVVLEKAEEPKIKLPTSVDHRKCKRVPEKHLFLHYRLCQSLWLCGSQQTGKFWMRWEYHTTWPVSWDICMQLRKQQLHLDIELVPNWERSTSRLNIETLLI